MACLQMDLKNGKGFTTSAMDKQLFYNYLLQHKVTRKSAIVRLLISDTDLVSNRSVTYTLDVNSFWEGYKQYRAVFGCPLK